MFTFLYESMKYLLYSSSTNNMVDFSRMLTVFSYYSLSLPPESTTTTHLAAQWRPFPVCVSLQSHVWHSRQRALEAWIRETGTAPHDYSRPRWSVQTRSFLFWINQKKKSKPFKKCRMFWHPCTHLPTPITTPNIPALSNATRILSLFRFSAEIARLAGVCGQ